MRVLHVTDSFVGGVATAVTQYVEALPDHHHAIVASSRGAAPPSVTGFDRHALAARPNAHLVREGLGLWRSWRPDVVHLHSSRAGLLRAVAPLRTSLVFSPHGFAFIRESVGGAGTRAHVALERGLARRRHVLAAVSGWEAETARSVGHRDVVLVPHAMPGDLASATWNGRVDEGPLRVGVLARIDPAKDPEFVARAARATSGTAVWSWAGGGDPATADALTRAGVAQLGWVDAVERSAFLDGIDVLVVLSRWEAAVPYGALEAISAGVPVIGRHIPALRDAEWMPRATTVDDVVRLLGAVESSVDRERLWSRQRDALLSSSVGQQATALEEVYARAIGSR